MKESNKGGNTGRKNTWRGSMDSWALETGVQSSSANVALFQLCECWVLCRASDSYLICKVEITVPTVTTMTTPQHDIFLYFLYLSVFDFWVYPYWNRWEACIRNLSGLPSPSWMTSSAWDCDGGHRWCQPPPNEVLLRSGSYGGSPDPSPPLSASGFFVDAPKTPEFTFCPDSNLCSHYHWKRSPEVSCSRLSGEPQPSTHLPHLPQSLSTYNTWNQKATTYYTY